MEPLGLPRRSRGEAALTAGEAAARVRATKRGLEVEHQKLIYLLWSPRRVQRAELRDTLLKTCAPRLLEARVAQLSMNIADSESRMRSPSPSLTFDRPLCAQVSVWLEEVEQRSRIEACLTGAGFEIAGYLVSETVYTDYGENRHSRPRDWPDGQRSPGVVQVTLLERPRRLAHEEWVRRWHGRMSPVSEAIQPRPRYVRNLVLKALTPGAPPFAGIVEEAWPTKRHVSNPFLYFGASSPWGLCRNLFRILGAVTSFLTLWRIRSTMMGEYFIRTDPRIPKLRRSAFDV
jgi:hypothetical protein